MLKRITILIMLLLATSSLQEATAKIIQVDFTAGLVGDDPGLDGIDNVIEGYYRFDDKTKGSETNDIGTIAYVELLEMRVRISEEVYFFNEGLIYSIQENTIPSGLKLEPFDVLYGVIVGEVIYPEISELDERNDPPLIADDLDDDGDSLFNISVDLDGDGFVDEVVAIIVDTDDLYVYDVGFKTVPDVLSPAIEIDFTSVFSVIDSEESLAPVPTGEGGSAKLTINYAVPEASGSEIISHVHSAEYQITSLTTAVVVPAPTAFCLLALAAGMLPQRRR